LPIIFDINLPFTLAVLVTNVLPNIQKPERMDDIQTYVKVGSLVPHSKVNFECHEILQGLEDFDEESDDISLRFKRLGQGIEGFRESLWSNTKSKQTTAQEDIERINKEIQELESKANELVPRLLHIT